MEFFTHNTNINFMGQRKWTSINSILLIALSIFSLFFWGLNTGLEFTGGYQIQINCEKHSLTQKTTQILKKSLQNNGFGSVQITTFGSHDLVIKMPVSANSHNSDSLLLPLQHSLQHIIKPILGPAQIININYIGPQVGKELFVDGLLALIISMICITIYLASRFEMRFAISAGVGLMHDSIILLGIFSAFQMEFTLITLAAILAVIGYSLNDTVVIYDRIRENLKKMQNDCILTVINRSINDTLSRTIITSGLTLLVVALLYFLGGPSLREFSLALILGVIIGTYSSIYIAGTLIVFRHDLKKLISNDC